MGSFVCDVRIPPRLVSWLRIQGHEAAHATEIGLEASEDAAIWNYALERNAVIVTKDKDFVKMSLAQPGPKVLLVCVGNSTNRILIERFAELLPRILRLFDAGQNLIELR